MYKSILRAVTEKGSVRAVEGAEGVRQVILFANGVLVFECSCPAMSICLLIKIKETAYLAEPRLMYSRAHVKVKSRPGVRIR